MVRGGLSLCHIEYNEFRNKRMGQGESIRLFLNSLYSMGKIPYHYLCNTTLSVGLVPLSVESFYVGNVKIGGVAGTV